MNIQPHTELGGLLLNIDSPSDPTLKMTASDPKEGDGKEGDGTDGDGTDGDGDGADGTDGDGTDGAH